MPKGNDKKSSKKVVGTTVAAKTSRSSTMEIQQLTDADIALRAYLIYEREGRPEGRHLEHWALAKAELDIA